MSIGEVCVREVVIAERPLPVTEAARLMRQHHVGDIVIVDRAGGKQRPVGIVTDRDIVVEVVAPGLAADTFLVGDLVGAEACVVRENEGVFETLRYMRSKGVRRMPVVDGAGDLVGIVTLDDLMELFAEELNELAKLVAAERRHEMASRP